MSITINALTIENVKRVKAVKIEPSKTGITIIGGKNNQGKTSILDSIAWALGGDKYKPTDATRDGSVVPPYLKLTLSNGLIVERQGVNSTLKVIDPDGRKSGQQLLNEFVEQLAIDLPKFISSSSSDKAKTLLKIIGVGEQLFTLEQKEKALYDQRHAIGQIADQKVKFAKEMPQYPDAPKNFVSASDLIVQQQGILVKNGENQRLRAKHSEIKDKCEQTYQQLMALQAAYTQLQKDLKVAEKSAENLNDESTAELERSIVNIEQINIQVRANLDKEKAEDDARSLQDQYAAMSAELEAVRTAKTDLLQGADLPLPGLAVADGELTYNGYKWDGMSGSDQLKVSVAIVRQLKPQCGFVLLDKLEQMDTESLSEFGEWLEKEGLQAIATRVSTGDECSVIIEDGYIVEQEQKEKVESKGWKAGSF
jgi:hypothetical protein